MPLLQIVIRVIGITAANELNVQLKMQHVPTVPIIRITLAPVPQTAMIARGSATMDFIAMAMNV